MTTCNVCQTPFGAPIYAGGSGSSLTTMNALIEGETEVFFCDTCGHAQTNELPDLERYYAEDYIINIEGDDDDQLYDVVDGVEIYRSQHQARVLTDKVDLSQGGKVLDYGCAKAATLRQIRANAPGIEAYLFDVTDKYIPFWEKFPDPKHFSAFAPDPAWKGQIDVLLSFYALEHIPDLSGILNDVKALLRDGGTFYFIVPNMYANANDMIVADHVNHFSRASLTHMLATNGFYDIDIDDTAHNAAFVVMARVDKTGTHAVTPPVPDLTGPRTEAQKLADFWGGIAGRIAAFEATLDDTAPRAIYGAGIYGNFIYSCLKNPEKVTHFIDQNRFLAGKLIHGRPVVPPAEYPYDDAALLVGLNPLSARRSIASVAAFEGKTLNFFFLD